MPASSTPATAPPGLNVTRANPSIHIARSQGFVYFHIFRMWTCKILFDSIGQCLHQNPAAVTQFHTPIPFPSFFYNMAFIPHAGRGHVTSRNGPGFFVRSFKFLDTVLFYSRGKNLCKPRFAWVIWTIYTKNGTLSEVLKILEATEKWKFWRLNYHRMRKC